MKSNAIRRYRSVVCCVLMLFAGTVSRLSADIIAVWENDHLAGNEVSTTAGEAPSAGSWNSDLAAAPVLERGAGGTATAYSDTFGMRNANAITLGNAITSNRYLSFSLTADPGLTMSVTNVFIRLQAQNATAYDVSFVLMSDATGFAEGDELVEWLVGGTGNSADWLGQERSVNLSAVSALQGLSTVEFRLYVYGQEGGAFAQVGVGRAFTTNGSDDLRVEGTFAVIPEPSVLAFLGLGGLLLRLRRRPLA